MNEQRIEVVHIYAIMKLLFACSFEMASESVLAFDIEFALHLHSFAI